MDETHKQAGDARPSADSGANGRPSAWRRPPVIVIGTVLAGALLFLGLSYLADVFTHESTDDAFIDNDIRSIAPKVSGQILQVAVRSNQKVKAGDLLVEIDGRDLQVLADEKRAAVESARANEGLLKAAVDLFQTQIASAEATAKQSAAEAAAAEANTEKARADLKRAQALNDNHTISPQEYDSARAAATWAEANLKAQQEKAASEQSKVAQAKAQFQAGVKACERAEAQTRQAEPDVKAAELNLSYTRVTAPADGFVTKKAVEPGNYVQTGQSLMALVPVQGAYVTANFKETQLRNIRPGQPVKITIDSVAGGPFSGHVDSIMAGSGARFSLLPPENAVGNYVKVVQRVPVKIVFDKPIESSHVLGPGMSVVPSVRFADSEIPEGVVALVAVGLALGIGMLWWVLARRKERGA
jgi:membrane fusion protein, multidrug efflux system